MAKEVVKKIKLQIPAGKATPAPPVGTVLGPAGINLQEFCTRFNDASKDKMGDIVPVEISIYDDRTFDFVLKTAGKHGFLSEQVDNNTMSPAWIIGLGWSHAMFIITLEKMMEKGLVK